MGLIWCLILLVNVKALATLSRKKKPNQPQWENGKGKYYCFQQCANAPDLHRPTDICVLGRALALITQRQWDTIRQSKSVLHICQETTPPSKPHIMDYFFSIVLFVFFIRRKNTRKVDLRVRSVVFTFDTIQKIPRDGWHSPRLIEQFVGTHKFYGFYYTLSIVPKQKTGRQ